VNALVPSPIPIEDSGTRATVFVARAMTLCANTANPMLSRSS